MTLHILDPAVLLEKGLFDASPERKRHLLSTVIKRLSRRGHCTLMVTVAPTGTTDPAAGDVLTTPDKQDPISGQVN